MVVLDYAPVIFLERAVPAIEDGFAGATQNALT
jgi:hypothetical protein